MRPEESQSQVLGTRTCPKGPHISQQAGRAQQHSVPVTPLGPRAQTKLRVPMYSTLGPVNTCPAWQGQPWTQPPAWRKSLVHPTPALSTLQCLGVPQPFPSCHPICPGLPHPSPFPHPTPQSPALPHHPSPSLSPPSSCQGSLVFRPLKCHHVTVSHPWHVRGEESLS